MSTDLDFAATLKAKSDQLNADDLTGGPITVQITGAKVPGGDQPVVLTLSGGHCPYRPCKTMRRALAAAWRTTDAGVFVGRWMTLYRDASIRFGNADVGGIRISHLSHIDNAVTLNLAETKGGKKRAWTFQPLKAPTQAGAPTANLDRVLADLHLTTDDVDRWLTSEKKKPLGERDDAGRAQVAAAIAGNDARIAAIRKLKAESSAGGV